MINEHSSPFPQTQEQIGILIGPERGQRNRGGKEHSKHGCHFQVLNWQASCVFSKSWHLDSWCLLCSTGDGSGVDCHRIKEREPYCVLGGVGPALLCPAARANVISETMYLHQCFNLVTARLTFFLMNANQNAKITSPIKVLSAALFTVVFRNNLHVCKCSKMLLRDIGARQHWRSSNPGSDWEELSDLWSFISPRLGFLICKL